MMRKPQDPNGVKEPKGTRRTSVPKQFTVETIGGWDEELLPEASREQWKEVGAMRRTCLFIAYRYVSWDLREDVWQETRLAMWRRLLKGPVDKLGGYVRETCKNEAIKVLKKVKARAEQFIGHDIDLLEKNTPVFDEETDARIKGLVENFVPELTPHEARIFVLRSGLKWSIKTVAESLEISEDAVKSAFYSAKQKLGHPGIRTAIFRRLNPE
ncbi:RNA polymerase sigma factor [Streptomyces sp. NPDC017991]|uniref:RNA polymerase sigma factor n=1 Tax=Streptomyces sp. NPDC017991 TaxID=3365026 RepID=UPI0037B5B75C